MTLSGYNKGTWIDYVFKQTGKPDGYIAAEEEQEEPKEEKNPNTSAKEVLLVLFGLTISILLLHTVNEKYIR